MKNKILLALAVLVLAFSLVGCGPSADQFVGEWKNNIHDRYNIFEDGTFLYEGWITWTEYTGTWIWNGDDTATLVDEDGNELVATYKTESETIIDKETGEETKKVKPYLIIDDVKFWKVKKED